MGFKDIVQRVERLVREKEEMTVEELAYIMDVSPTQARYYLKATSAVNSDIIFHKGRAWVLKQKKEQTEQ